MKSFNTLPGAADVIQAHSSRYSLLPRLISFVSVLAILLLASFPIASQGQRIDQEKPVIYPPAAEAVARIDFQDRIASYHHKEVYLRLWMQFELLRPKPETFDRQTPGSIINNLPLSNIPRAAEFLVF